MSPTRERLSPDDLLLIVDTEGLQNTRDGCIVGRVDEDLELILALLERLRLHLLRNVVHDAADAQSSEFW